jgi:long-chain fatty acid transport protein
MRLGASVFVLSCFAASALASGGARANPLDTFGFGSRETALAGAVSADVQGFASAYYNPAALARSKSLDLSIGYFRADHALETNGNDNHVDPVKGLVGGFVLPGELFGLPLAFGLALHLPDERISRVRALRQEQPRWELYDNRNQRLYLAANLAVSPWPWLQFGGGLSFMSSTKGRLDIGGSANIFRPDDSQLRHEVDADLTAVRYPQLGIRAQLGKRVALAAVYRGEFKLRLDLTAYLHGDISGLTTAIYRLETHSVNNFLPQQVVVGGAWSVTDDVKAMADLTWVNWSAYIPPVASLDVLLDIPAPAGGWPPTITPPTAPAPARVVPLVLYDRIVPRIGVEWRALHVGRWEAFARGGYEYAKSPIAPQVGVTNYIDRDRHSGSLGVGVKLNEPFEELAGNVRLDVHAQYSQLVSEVTRKADPADLVGDYSAGGHVWSFGATLGVGF